MIFLWTLSVQPESLVNRELAAQAVDSGDNGSCQDNTQWDQLRWNLLERANALGDRVGWIVSLALGVPDRVVSAQVPRCSSAYSTVSVSCSLSHWEATHTGAFAIRRPDVLKPLVAWLRTIGAARVRSMAVAGCMRSMFEASDRVDCMAVVEEGRVERREKARSS